MTTPVRTLAALLWLASLAAGCGSSSGSADAGPLPVEQCTSANDLSIIDALATSVDGGIPDGGVPDGGPYPYAYLQALGDEVNACSTAGTCLPAIIADEDPTQCLATCLEATEAAGIGLGCLGCYVEIIHCTGQYCATECLGSNPDLCSACGQEHCGDRMAECTGITGRPL